MNEVSGIIKEQKKKLKADKSMKIKDSKCPFTSKLRLRNKTFIGIVVSKDTHGTAKVEWSKQYFVKKYERFMKKRTKIAAHNPEAINANVGDVVLVAECRPLSKTKKFVIIKRISYSKKFMVKKEVIEEDKKVQKESKPRIMPENKDEVLEIKQENVKHDRNDDDNHNNMQEIKDESN